MIEIRDNQTGVMLRVGRIWVGTSREMKSLYLVEFRDGDQVVMTVRLDELHQALAEVVK